jgi:hypothetical protein
LQKTKKQQNTRSVTEVDQPLLKEAFISQKDTSKPLILQGINMSIGMVCFIMVIHALIATVALPDPSTPIFISIILLILFIGEVLILIWLIRVRKSTPAALERVIRHLSDTE